MLIIPGYITIANAFIWVFININRDIYIGDINYIKNNGTGVNTQDSGGNFILIINLKESHHVYIENNYFEDWGRVGFSIYLGGEGQRFENYKCKE